MKFADFPLIEETSWHDICARGVGVEFRSLAFSLAPQAPVYSRTGPVPFTLGTLKSATGSLRGTLVWS
jgi:hypothetical protein